MIMNEQQINTAIPTAVMNSGIVNIRCSCGSEINVKTDVIKRDIICPRCGEDNIVIRTEGSVGIGV